MGKNKLAKFRDMHEYKHVLEYPFARLREEAFPYKGRWHEFFGNDHPIVLELGCGKGEYTLALGRLNPDVNYIGIDVKGARMWSGAKQVAQEGLKNVAFLRGEIEMIEQFFAPGEVAEIWITFPDPQMKKYRKRLTSTRFIDKYLSILKEGGLVQLKTDSPFLYTYTKAMVAQNELPIQTDYKDVYSEAHPESLLRTVQTYYETQWLSRGLTIKFLSFIPIKREEWQEPDIEIPLDDYRSFGRSKRLSDNKTSNKQ